MRLVFRADASPVIGAGHVMRLSAIAEKALEEGHECLFVGDLGDISWVADHIKSLGFSAILHPDLLPAISEVDRILILDSYNIDPKLDALRLDRWKKVVVIFDEVTPEYEAQISIHPGLANLDRPSSSGEIYSGVQYIPFRSAISRQDASKVNQEEVLVFAGGTDTFGFASEMANILKTLKSFNRAKFFSNDLTLEQVDKRFSVQRFGADLDSSIETSKLIFTSASTSALEVAARGIAVGIATLTQNQIVYHDAMVSHNVAISIGSRNIDSSWNLDVRAIEKLLFDDQFRRHLQENCLDFFDFQGSKRILNLILG